MRLDTSGQVAVITGAARGIGLALAVELAARGLALALLDIETSTLKAAARAVLETAAPTSTVRWFAVDVSNAGEVSAVAASVLAELGHVDLLVNNAGVVGPRRPVWEQGAADFEWVLGVNLNGVINGMTAFLPAMVKAGQGHVLTTASVAALTVISGGGNGPYAASKHAVAGLCEVLREDLRTAGVDIGVTVLCPGPVDTRIRDAARNRPAGRETRDQGVPQAPSPSFTHAVPSVSPRDAAVRAIAAVEQGAFWVLTHDGNAAEVKVRLDEISAEVLPTAST